MDVGEVQLPGHVAGLFDGSNQVVNRYRYSPFGTTEHVQEGTSNPLRYMARELDSTTGLYYVRARWYDPELERFASEDLIGLAGGINLYKYAGNDPVNFTDPSGLCTFRGPVYFSGSASGGYTGQCRGGSGTGSTFGSRADWEWDGSQQRLSKWDRIAYGVKERTAPWQPVLETWASAVLIFAPGSGATGVATRLHIARPLAPAIASTFRGGAYRVVTLAEDVTLYRVISPGVSPTGRYWTRNQPGGPLQAVIDFALDQSWGNRATQVVVARIPAGTKIYEGAAAAQQALVGGGNQIFIPWVSRSWIQRILTF